MLRQRKPRPSTSKARKRPRQGVTRTVVTDRVVSVPPSVRDLQYFDINGTGTTAAANMAYVSLFNPVQGTASTSRFGDKIVMHSIQWKMKLNNSITLPIRIVLIYDSQPNGAVPTTPAPLTALRTEAFKDPDTRHRFTVIRDWYITNTYGTTVSTNDQKHDAVQTGLTQYNGESYFTGNAGTVADLRTGSYVLCFYNTASEAAFVYEYRFLFSS